MKMEKVYLTLLIISIIVVVSGVFYGIKQDQEKLKQKTIIYFVSFESVSGKHDRFTRYKYGSLPPNFLDWIQEKRKEVEVKNGCSAVINCKIINQ